MASSPSVRRERIYGPSWAREHLSRRERRRPISQVVGWVGWIPTTLVVSVYFVLVYYTTGRSTLELAEEKDSVKALLEDLDLDPDLDVLIYDTTKK